MASLDTTSALALGPEGSPIENSDYTIDLHQGPVLESSRVIGLGGSVTPFVDGVVGYAVNPASAAVRSPHSVTFFDWELDASVGSPGSGSDTDFDANGRVDAASKKPLFVTLGGGLQWGTFGVGLRADVNEYEVLSGTGTPLLVDVARVNLVAAFALFRGQLAVGAGVGVYGVELSQPAEEGDAASLAASEGGSAQLGIIWAPNSLSLRAGAAVRTAVPDGDDVAPEGTTPDAEGNVIAQGFVFPKRIVPPTELHAAVATQLFRPFNPGWRVPSRSSEDPSPEERRRLRAPRTSGHLLLSAGAKVTLPVPDAVGVESFLTQRVERSGRSPTVSPRVGVETEPWVNAFILRAGSYYEPSRFSASASRVHVTAGLDVHVPVRWSIFGLADPETTFKIGGAIDQAPRYFGWNATIGLWR